MWSLFAIFLRLLFLFPFIHQTETPAAATEKIFFETDDVHKKAPKEIRINWNAYNLTSNANANIMISLWGYRETTIQ